MDGAELRRAEAARGLSLAALNCLALPVFAVSPQGRLLLANSAGEQRLLDGLPVTLSCGTLTSKDRSTQALLAAALKAAARDAGSSFSVGLGEAKWMFRVEPVAAISGAVLVFTWLGTRPPVQTWLLREMLNLSVSEAEVARMIADGWSAKEIAYARQVSLNTVRSQVRAILQKAGVRRQVDLVKMLAAMPVGAADTDTRAN